MHTSSAQSSLFPSTHESHDRGVTCVVEDLKLDWHAEVEAKEFSRAVNIAALDRATA